MVLAPPPGGPTGCAGGAVSSGTQVRRHSFLWDWFSDLSFFSCISRGKGTVNFLD